MAPPELAADAPVGDVVHPLVVGVDPVLGNKAHIAACYCIDSALRNTGARWSRFVHRNKPLVGEHGLNHLAGAGAARHHEFVLFDFHQEAAGLQVGYHLFAGHKAVQALVGNGGAVVDFGVQRQHADHGQLVALAHGIVVLVVCGRDLDHAGAKRLVHVVIRNHRNLAPLRGRVAGQG